MEVAATVSKRVQWNQYPWIHVPKNPKRFKSFEKRMAKYANNGQFVEGHFFCKLGRPINEDRVLKYEAMCHKIVRSYLPALALYEAAWDYEDLINMCRREIFLALLDGFDPVKALSCNEKDPSKKQKRIDFKLANLEKTYQQAEKNIVYGRIQNFIRRERYAFHPETRGGSSIPYAALGSVHEEGSVVIREFENGLYEQPNHDWLLSSRLKKLADQMMDLQEHKGNDAVLNKFKNLSETEKKDLVDLLLESSHAY